MQAWSKFTSIAGLTMAKQVRKRIHRIPGLRTEAYSHFLPIGRHSGTNKSGYGQEGWKTQAGNTNCRKARPSWWENGRTIRRKSFPWKHWAFRYKRRQFDNISITINNQLKLFFLFLLKLFFWLKYPLFLLNLN